MARSQEELNDVPGGYLQQQHPDYQHGGSSEHWNQQVSSSVESSTSSQEHLNYSNASVSTLNKGHSNHKSGPGRWKTPGPPPGPGPGPNSQPTRTDLPPPPPPPPAHYDYEPHPDMPLPPPLRPLSAAAV